jgi:DNA topoisomerase-1
MEKRFINNQFVEDNKMKKNSEDMEIYTGTGKFGPYVKIKESEGKWRYAKLTESSVDKVTLEEAISLLEWPKSLGKLGNAIVTLNKGQYGLYIKCSGKNYSIKDTVDPNNINLKFAEDLIQAGDPYALKTFKVKDKVINIKCGEFGNYLQIISKTRKQNISIPKKNSIENITIEQVLQIIANKNGTKSSNKNELKK